VLKPTENHLPTVEWQASSQRRESRFQRDIKTYSRSADGSSKDIRANPSIAWITRADQLHLLFHQSLNLVRKPGGVISQGIGYGLVQNLPA
jgi:hypothetical protein